MNSLEKKVLASSYLHYNRISFLEPKDFVEPINRRIWGLLKESNFEIEPFFNRIKSEGDFLIINEYFANLEPIPVIVVSLKVNAIYLVEQRIKRELSDTIAFLAAKSKIKIEAELLLQIQLSIPKNDILEICDGINEYLGVHISGQTSSTLTKFLSWKDQRILNIKNT